MTLKVRILVAMAVVAGFLVATSWVVTSITASHLINQSDAQLARFASGRGGEAARMPPREQLPKPGVEATEDEIDPGAFASVYVGAFVDGNLETLISPDGRMDTEGIPRVDVAVVERLAASGGYASVPSNVTGSRYRVTVRTGPPGELIVFGLPLDDVDATVRRLVLTEAVATVGVLVVLALILWWVLRLGVRPVKRMTLAAATIAAGDLSHRVPEEAPGTEAHDLGVALNAMLEHIEEAFATRAASQERLRRFVADASHELRTPLTTVRGYAELYRQGGLADPASLDAAMARTEAEAQRMSRLVEDLLTLARLDQHQSPEPEVVDLADVVADVAADVAVRFADHEVVVDAEAVCVKGVPDALHQVVANLVTNAAIHTGESKLIEVGLKRRDGYARLIVRDHGPGMDEADAERAFERFWRADVSRTRTSGGSGLGLAIVAAVVQSMGGSVHLARPDDGDGLEAVVELPVSLDPRS